MQEQNDSLKPLSSGVFIHVLSKYRNHLAIIGIVTVVLATIFSSPFFITPLYKSTVILYPTASKSISKVLLSENPGNSKDILEFGEEEQTEQMLQVLNSNKIRDKVIVKYDLLSHYDIPENSPYKMTKLYKEYESNIKFRRTEYMAVKITVLDKDAQLAADIANDIAELVDSTINQMQKEVAIKAFKIVESEYLSLKEEVKEKEDSLTILRGYGVHDYESQSEMFNRQLAIEMAKGNTAGVKRLEEKLEMLAKYGGPYVSLRDALEHDKKQLSELKAKYEESKVDATEDLPHKFVVSNAYKAEKKSYPIRWLIVTISLISILILASFIFGLLEVYQGEIAISMKKKSPDKKPVKGSYQERNTINSPQPLQEKAEHAAQDDIEKNKSLNKKTETKESGIVDTKNKTKGDPEPEKKDSKGDQIDKEMENYFNSKNLLHLMEKWRLHLLVIVVAAAILAAIFSGPTFITPMYKSHAVVYPANVDSYSDESETEQMLQIMGSQDIVDSMIEKFNLPDHYEIDRNYKYFRTALLTEYHENVSINKTPYEGVMIEVQDKDPNTAAKMVEAILNFYDQKVAYLHKSKYKEVMDMYEKQLNLKQATLDSLKNIMYELGTEYGLIEYGYQSQEIMKGYLKTITGQGPDRVNSREVKRLFENMQKKSGQLIEVVAMIQDEAHSYTSVKLDYELAVRFYNADMTYSNIVTMPFPADKKSYPIRWLIVVVVTLAAFIFAMLVLLFIEKRAYDRSA